MSNSANGHTTLSFDSTSTSKYSSIIKNAAYGAGVRVKNQRLARQ